MFLVAVDEYESRVNYRYGIPEGYGIVQYQDIPAHTIKVICPPWWRNPNKRNAIYSLMVDDVRDNIYIPEDAIWSPMMDMDYDLQRVEGLIHWQIEHKLVSCKSGMSIRKGKLRHSALCASVKLHLILDEDGADDLGILGALAMCYIAPDGYIISLYLYENDFECGKYGVLELDTGPLSYDGLKKTLVAKVKAISPKKLVAFVQKSPKTIQFPSIEEKPTLKKQNKGEQR